MMIERFRELSFECELLLQYSFSLHWWRKENRKKPFHIVKEHFSDTGFMFRFTNLTELTATITLMAQNLLGMWGLQFKS